jgi:hypothetical protein
MKGSAIAHTLVAILGVGFLPSSRALAQSQTATIPRIELKANEKLPVANQPASGGIDLIRCDSHGNVYMRPVSGKTRGLLAPVLRISADGQRTTLFDLSNLPELRDASGYEIYDFSVGRDGSILELAGVMAKNGETFPAAVQIDADGKPSSLIRFDSHLSPRQIAPMPSGMFLLAGIERSSKLEGTQFRQSGRPFTGIFDSRGRLIREIQLPGDIKIEDIDSSTTDKPDTRGSQAVDLSRFIVSDDGTIYLLRSVQALKVYVISSAGEILRSFEVASPAEDASPPTMFYSGGHLAFDFFVSDSKDDPRMRLLIRVLDAQTGQILWDYVPAKDVFGIPACYNGQDFTLLSTTADHRLALLRLSPR